ncbi:ABC transporter permease subunit [Nonomuraea rubra]|uniref:Peptide/nickel transport system permease protein n=1 Tax=Nonomuraea rubra TaxID=46180 RepID=A0A7X0NYD5_9ACTN|nr:ABC transporter permease subunit [Nonomuraea rubra]MBB6551661.1 peptide/nickel transport system permease protein [Nonomuraea rubra]
MKHANGSTGPTPNARAGQNVRAGKDIRAGQDVRAGQNAGGRRRSRAALVLGALTGAVLLVALGGGTVLLDTAGGGAVLLDTAGGGAAGGHDPVAIVAPPWAGPAPGLPLGADALGRDVLARVLAGGRDLTLTALAAASTASALGVAGGLWVGWSRGRLGRTAAGAADLLLALPLLLLALLAVVALPGPAAVVAGTVLGGTPLTLRVVADATAAARHAGYVEAALSRGERAGAVLLREVLPAHAGLVGADLGQRLVLAVQLAAALNVLGFGPAPPAPDWAAMLRENLQGLGLNAAAAIAPAVALAVLAGSVAAFAHVLATRDGLP